MSNIIRSIKSEFVYAVAAKFAIEHSRIPSLVRDAIRVANGDPIKAEAPRALALMELENRGLVQHEPEVPENERTNYEVLYDQAHKDLMSIIKLSGLKQTIEIERQNRRKTGGSAFRSLMTKYQKEAGFEGLCSYVQAALDIRIKLTQDGRPLTGTADLDPEGGSVYHDYSGTLKSIN